MINGGGRSLRSDALHSSSVAAGQHNRPSGAPLLVVQTGHPPWTAGVKAINHQEAEAMSAFEMVYQDRVADLL